MICRFAKQYNVAYLPYDVAVDAARARLAKPTN